MLLAFQPRKQSHRRAGNDAAPPVPPDPVDVYVVSVTAVGDAVSADWLFDADVASVGDPGCLLLGPDAPGPESCAQIGPRTLRCAYTSGVAPGYGWYLRPDLGNITFDPPGTLSDQDGTVAP